MKRFLLNLLFMGLMVPWMTQAQTPTPATLPYTCGFEDTVENAAWTIVNGTATNKFFIGTAENASNGGTRGLYISDNATGTTNSYTITSSGYVGAYREFTVATAGSFVFQFDWKAYAESCCDYLRAFIIPGTDSLTPYNGSSTTHSGISTTGLPSGWIAIDGSRALNYMSTWQHSETPEIALPAGTYKLVFYWRNDGSVGTQPPGAIDNIVISPISCSKPGDFASSNITPYTATVSWQESATATQWIVEYDTLGFTPGTGIATLVTDTTFAISGLNPNTEYEVLIRAFCGVTDTSLALRGSFRTTCLPYSDTLPYIETFEAYPASSSITTSYIDPCWTRWSTSTSTTSVYPYVTSTGSGNKGIYMYNSASFYTVLAMPSFEEPLNTLQLSFRMARVSTSSESPLIVGVMSDPNDITTFDTIAIVSCLLQSTWQNFEIPLSIYEGEGLHVAFLTASGISTGNYLDDITINVIPQCAVPTNVVASNITGTTADITWDEGNGSAWIVEYGPAGFIPGTGEGTEEAVSATTFSMVDLVPSTGYDVWVRTDCGDDTSYYSLCCSFRTPCAETLPIPFTETFEGYGFGSSVRPDCWTYQGYNNNASYPQVSASQHYSGTSSLYMYSYKSSSDTATPWTYLMTPPIDTETYPMNTLQVSFRALATSLGSSYPGTVIIGIVNDTADIRGSFYPIDTIAVTNTYEWQEMEVFLNQYPEDGTGRHILIASAPVLPAGSTSSYLYNYVYVDNLTIELIPECARPSSIAVRDVTDNSVTLEWEDTFESHSAWEVIYDSVGFDIDSIEATQTAITISNITADTVLIPNLAPGVFYDFYVRTDCNGDYSRWRGPLTAAAGTYNMAKTGSDTIYACDMTIYDDGGAFGNYSASCNTTLVIYPSSTDSVISISGSYAGESCCDYLKIYDGVGTTGTQYCNIMGSNNNIGPFVSRTGPITIVYTSDGSGQYAGFELHAQCVEQSDCGFVTEVVTETVAAQSAFVRWDYSSEMPDTPTQFELELEEVGEESNTVVRTITTPNPYFMIADLEPTTTYNVRVRSICGTDVSPIFGLATFTTRCLVGGEIEIGDGDYTTEEIPVEGCYEYSYTQQIYLASEMNGATEITGVSFFLDEGTGDDEREIVVYIGHTDSTHFATPYNVIIDSLMTVVYDDTYEFTEGWNNIMFDDAFEYNGTSNIVIAFDDNTGYYNCSPYFTAHNTTSSMAVTMYQDGDDILPSNPTTMYDDQYLLNYRNNIKFISPCDDETPVTCLAPNMALVDLTPYSIKTIWAQGYNETSWKVEYKLTTDTTWTVAVASTTDTFYTINNLTPNTEYDVRIASICGTETLYGATRTTYTLCAPYTIPFSEGFETWTASSSPTAAMDRCWDRYTNYVSQWTIYPYVSTSYAHTGSKAMYMYASSSYHSILTLPEITVPIDSLEVSFYMRKSTASHLIVVGVIDDPTNINTFTPIDTVSPATLNVWELFEISMDSYTGTGGRIAFVSPQMSNYPYIDDISVDYIPTCPHVRNIDDSITGADYSIIDWTDPSTATAWEIEYGPEGFTPGTGAGTTEIALSHPHTLMNLTPATKYDIYVRGICGAEDTAKWWGSSIMTRACEDAFDYTVYNDTTYTGAYLPMHTYYNYSYTQQIYLPSEVDTLTGGGAEIEINSIAFQYKLAEEITRRNVRIFLGHTTDSSFASTTSWIPDSTLQQVYFGDITWNNSGTDYWFEIIFDTAFTYNGVDNLVLAVFDSTKTYTNSSNKFGFIKNAGDYKTLYKYQDSPVMDRTNLPTGTRYEYRNTVKFVSCGGACPKPVGLTVEPGSTTADLSWATIGNYEIVYKQTSETDWSSEIAANNTNTFTVTGLQPETDYDFQVRQVCDSVSTSAWALISTTTTELPCVAPMGFSASNIELTSATIAWTDSLNNQEAWKVAYGYGADASAWDTIDVTTASVNLTDLYSNTEYTVYVKAYCSVEADVTSEWSDAFTFRTATCEGVSNITSSAVTANSATINWTPGANQTKWEISYGMEGVSEANGTKVVVENTPAYTIEGLESDLTYDVYVRTVCEEGVYSAWSNKIQFRTTVGINTASADNVRVQIYPNPANSEATITVDGVNGKVEFVLADMNGRMIVTETINCEGSLVKTIDVSNLAKGAYFVHIYNDDFNTTRKLIVK